MVNGILTVVNWLVPLAYLALVIDYGATFFLRIRTHVRNPWILAPIVLHSAFVTLRGIHLGYPPLASGQEVLSVVALSSAFVYWVMELVSRDRRAGVFVFLLIFLFQYTSSVFLAHEISEPAASAGSSYSWTRLHIVPAVLAYTALTFSAVYGLLHLIGRRNIRQHHFGVFFDRLPALDLLGKLSWYALVIGFIFISMSIITGVVVFSGGTTSGQSHCLDTAIIFKIVIGSIAWVICATAVIGKVVAKWPISRIALIAVSGFLAIVILLAASMVFA